MTNDRNGENMKQTTESKHIQEYLDLEKAKNSNNGEMRPHRMCIFAILCLFVACINTISLYQSCNTLIIILEAGSLTLIGNAVRFIKNKGIAWYLYRLFMLASCQVSIYTLSISLSLKEGTALCIIMTILAIATAIVSITALYKYYIQKIKQGEWKKEEKQEGGVFNRWTITGGVIGLLISQGLCTIIKYPLMLVIYTIIVSYFIVLYVNPYFIVHGTRMKQ